MIYQPILKTYQISIPIHLSPYWKRGPAQTQTLLTIHSCECTNEPIVLNICKSFILFSLLRFRFYTYIFIHIYCVLDLILLSIATQHYILRGGIQFYHIYNLVIDKLYMVHTWLHFTLLIFYHACMYLYLSVYEPNCTCNTIVGCGISFHLHKYARMKVIYLHWMNVIGTFVAY